MADYSHYPEALRPKSKKVKEEQRAQRQRVRSKVAQSKARKTEKAKSKWENVKQTSKDVAKDAASEAAMAALPPVKAAKYAARLAELTKKLKKVKVLKPGQEITKGPIGRARKSTPKTDYSTRNIPKPKSKPKPKRAGKTFPPPPKDPHFAPEATPHFRSGRALTRFEKAQKAGKKLAKQTEKKAWGSLSADAKLKRYHADQANTKYIGRLVGDHAVLDKVAKSLPVRSTLKADIQKVMEQHPGRFKGDPKGAETFIRRGQASNHLLDLHKAANKAKK